jgi:Holliday junction resolvase RusA-like endonuclease
MTEPTPLRIDVRGMPHPQPRPRFVKGQGAVSTIGPRVKAWRMRLAAAISDAAVAIGEAEVERFHQGALSLRLEFRIPVQAEKPGWVGLYHHLPPDTDNLAKPVMDELQAAKILPDDGRIAELSVRKVWCRAQDAGCTVLLAMLPAPMIGRVPAGYEAWAKAQAPGWLEAENEKTPA